MIYVAQLDKNTQKNIEKDLTQALEELGFVDQELEELVMEGMESKLHDLSDTINIEPYLEK